MLIYDFFPSHLPKVQRTLTVPVLFNTESEVRPKAVQAAPALSRALARVLNATESKENEREEKHSDTDVEENTKSTKPSGKTIFSSSSCMKLLECKTEDICSSLTLYIKGM